MAPTDLTLITRASIPYPSTQSADFAAFISDLIKPTVELLDTPSAWTQGKTFKTPTDTTATSTAQAMNPHTDKAAKHHWNARTTLLPIEPEHNVTYPHFLKYLGHADTHTAWEKLYMTLLKKVKRLEVLVPGVVEIWHTFYDMPIATAKRDFVVLVVAHPDRIIPDWPVKGDETSFCYYSVPIDHPDAPPQHGFTRGYYESIERVSIQGDQLKWEMTTRSDPSGMIPALFSEPAIPKAIAHDVPLFLEWLRRQPAQVTNEGEGRGETNVGVEGWAK